MVTPPAEHSNGAPYWDEGHGGAGSRIRQQLLQRAIGADGEAVDLGALTHTSIRSLLEQLGLGLGEESRATVLRADGLLLLTPFAERGTVGNLVHRNAGGGTSVHGASTPGNNVYVAPGRVYMAAAEFVAAGGERGGGLIQPLLLFPDLVGVSGRINGAPQSSGDGVAGNYWPLAVTGVFPIGDGGTADFGWGALADAFPGGDGGAADFGGGALALTDVFPGGDGENPYVGWGALAVTDVFPREDGENPYLGWGALALADDVFPGGDGEDPYLGSVAGDGGGANARDEHVIDMPLAPAAGGTNEQARRYLEELLFNFLPASVVALGPLEGASDRVKLATFVILTVLIVLLVAGRSSRASARHVARLSACAGIFAMTVFVSAQFSRGIYVAVAALVGVALCGIALAV